MKPYVTFSQAAFLFCATCFFAVSCSKSGTDLPGSTGDPGGGTDDDISLTTPVAYTGNVPEPPDADPVPQESAAYAPYVGVWKENNGNGTFVFLPDGHVAFTKLNNGKTEKYVGVYFPSNTDGWFDFVWKNDASERLSLSADGNVLTVEAYRDFSRVGEASAAEVAYSNVYTALKQEAQARDAQYPVGHVTNPTPDAHDPHPDKVIKGANVFTTGVHFQNSYTSDKWYDMPDGTIEGFDGYSRTDVWLLPNGRFFMQLWLWDGVNPQNKMESFTHQASWGRYTVIKGSNAIDGDVINFKYDNGATAAYRTVVGQSCFLTKAVVYYQK